MLVVCRETRRTKPFQQVINAGWTDANEVTADDHRDFPGCANAANYSHFFSLTHILRVDAGVFSRVSICNADRYGVARKEQRQRNYIHYGVHRNAPFLYRGVVTFGSFDGRDERNHVETNHEKPRKQNDDSYTRSRDDFPISQ